MSLATRITSVVQAIAAEFNALRGEQVDHIFWNSTTDTWPAANLSYDIHHWHSEHDPTATPPTGLSGSDIWWPGE